MEHKELIKKEIKQQLDYWTHEFIPGDNSGKLMQSIMIKKLTLQLNAHVDQPAESRDLKSL